MKRLFAASALLATIATPILAETTIAPKTELSEPAAAKSSNGMFYSQVGDWRASKLMGVKVTNNSGETIGDINDVLIDKSGKVVAIVIGVGGFLGMAERHAAVAFSSIQLTRDANDKPLAKVDVTKDQLKSAPEWTWQAASAK